MPATEFIWNEEPGGNIEHIAENGLSPEDVEEAVLNPVGRAASRTSGLPILFGFSLDGRFIAVIYEKVDEATIYPVTAYEVEV